GVVAAAAGGEQDSTESGKSWKNGGAMRYGCERMGYRRLRRRHHERRRSPTPGPLRSIGFPRQIFSCGRDCRRSDSTKAAMKRMNPTIITQRIRSELPPIMKATTIIAIAISRM